MRSEPFLQHLRVYRTYVLCGLGVSLLGCSSSDPACEQAYQHSLEAPVGVYKEVGYGETFAEAKYQALEKLAYRKELHFYHQLELQEVHSDDQANSNKVVSQTELSSNALFRDPLIQAYSCNQNKKMVVATVDGRTLSQRLAETELTHFNLATWFKSSQWILTNSNYSFSLVSQDKVFPMRGQDLLDLFESPTARMDVNGKGVWYGKSSDRYQINLGISKKKRSLVKLGENGQFTVLFADKGKGAQKYVGKQVLKHYEQGSSVLFIAIEHEQPIQKYLPNTDDVLTLSQQQTALTRFARDWQAHDWEIATVRYYIAQ